MTVQTPNLWEVRWKLDDEDHLTALEIVNPCGGVEDTITVREIEEHPDSHILVRERIQKAMDIRRVRRYAAWLRGEEGICV